MKKLLITGAGGFLGWNLCQQAKLDWEIYGTYSTHPVAISQVTFMKVDLTDFSSLQQLFALIKPDAVIHTAAQSQPNFCQKYPHLTHSINVTVSVNIAGLCADYNIPYAFTSTDLVFDGLNPPYQENDSVSPISYYGEQKSLAEQGILSLYPQAAICRMPLMFGVPSPNYHSFIQPFMQILREGKELSLFQDEFRTPVSATTAVKGLLLALEKVAGVIHLGGKERISRYQFGCLMAAVLNLPKNKITPCLQKDVPMAAPRSPDVSLDSSKAFNLGYHPLSIGAELEALKGKI